MAKKSDQGTNEKKAPRKRQPAKSKAAEPAPPEGSAGVSEVSSLERLKERAGEALEGVKATTEEMYQSFDDKKFGMVAGAALIGTGAWLLYRGSARKGSVMADATRSAQTMASERVQQAEALFSRNPLAIGAAAAAAGLAFGLLLPDTRLENRTLGAAKQQLIAGVQSKLQASAAAVGETVTALKDKAMDAASLVDRAATVAGNLSGPA